MIESFGWIGTALILLGTFINARGHFLYAFIIWIIGDITWIIYDLYINNFSHLSLSATIILINLYGIYNNRTRIKRNDTTNSI
jgi:hypothetical protein